MGGLRSFGNPSQTVVDITLTENNTMKIQIDKSKGSLNDYRFKIILMTHHSFVQRKIPARPKTRPPTQKIPGKDKAVLLASILPIEEDKKHEKTFVLAHFTRQNTFFKKRSKSARQTNFFKKWQNSSI